MPRLLLVDDNLSIHKIAETLLTATDIELTCATSGAEALDKVASAGPFDVALLDTTMLGMDGWELLDRLRANESTARMPIAMMAGVLDVVNPEAVRKAPIQGFLKKPVELRDLAERIHTLIATPVEAPEPEEAAEETFAPEPEEASAPDPSSTFATLPFLNPADHLLHAVSDLLLLEPGDVLAEEPPVEAAPTAVEESLELEELDFDSLKGLNPPPPPEEAAAGPLAEEISTLEDMGDLPDFAPEDAFPAPAPEPGIVSDELPDLGPSMELTETSLPGMEEPVSSTLPPHLLPSPQDLSVPDDWSDESETLLELTADTGLDDSFQTDLALAAPSLAEGLADNPSDQPDFGPDSFLDLEPGPEPTPAFLPEIPEPVAAEAEPLQEPSAERATVELPTPTEIDPLPDEDTFRTEASGGIPPWAEPTGLIVSPLPPELEAPLQEGTQADPLAAILADPVLMDRLAKAVIARLGDEVLREIAWEVLPEAADRLSRN